MGDLRLGDWRLLAAALVVAVVCPWAASAQLGPSTQPTAQTPLTIDVKDYVAMPITGSPDGTGQTDGMLSRVNTLREEPGGAKRLFVSDMNGPLYILDKETKKLTTYLDFNGHDARPGIFHRLVFDAGYGNGLAHFQFDPDYARNGRFYTVLIENPSDPASNLPDNSHVPGLKVTE